MRRATNNKRGRWVEVALKTADNESIVAPTLYAYEMRQKGLRYYITFTKGGKLFDTGEHKVLAAVPIKPPKWAGNMWDVSDEAERVNHFASLYDACYKTILADSHENDLNREIRYYQRIIDFLTKLKTLEPWK